MSDIYLNPDVTRWTPTTENDLQRALDEGLLEETHYLDLKREIPSGSRANKELARDMAQFAIDGGVLVVGVEEVKDHPPELRPQPIAGLSERVEQIARTAIDPPLAVSTTAIPSGDSPGVGYLLIHVPASAQAPHMVDGTYHGRGDKTRHRLSDAEVRRLHDARATRGSLARQELAKYIGRDPVPAEHRE